MSCNSCSKAFSFMRPEKGCPGCGFSYCSKCLSNKIFLQKTNSEVKVCSKCKNTANSKNKVNIEPPDSYYKRIAGLDPQTNSSSNNKVEVDPIEEEIRIRLQKLKNASQEPVKNTDKDIAERLQSLKDVPTTSQTELEERLAKLKNVPVDSLKSKPIVIKPDLRTEQEQADDLLKQYMENVDMDKKYNDEFEEKVNEIQMRLQKLKESAESPQKPQELKESAESEDEEEVIKKIIEKAKKEATLDNHDEYSSPSDELPFCEICNEDAKMRCLGCKYLFCKRCFMEHRDEDDGCDKYENYTAPKSFNY